MLQVRCAHPTGTGEPGKPLRRCAPAPLTQGSQGNPSGAARQLPLHRGARATPQARSGLRRGVRETPQALRASSPYTGEPGQPLKRGAACEGESGQPLRRCAPAPSFAPTQLFELRRCCAWLIFRFRTDPPSVRRCSARLIRQAETLELQPLRGLHQATLCSFLQNAHASGSLREPYGYRGAKAALRAALLREKRPRRRLLRGRWRREIGIFTASGGCRPVRCGRR